MKPSSIEEMWDAYCTAAGLQGTGVALERYEEARRAFFGGMLDMFAALSQVSELTESEADETLAGWHDEFNAYANDLAVKLTPPEKEQE